MKLTSFVRALCVRRFWLLFVAGGSAQHMLRLLASERVVMVGRVQRFLLRSLVLCSYYLQMSLRLVIAPVLMVSPSAERPPCSVPIFESADYYEASKKVFSYKSSGSISKKLCVRITSGNLRVYYSCHSVGSSPHILQAKSTLPSMSSSLRMPFLI